MKKGFLSIKEKALLRKEVSLERYAKYYRNNFVKKFSKTSKIQLLFLPLYLPNLNLIERLWRLLKKAVLGNKNYDKFADFRDAILNSFTEIQTYASQLQSLMTLDFHTIGT